MRKSIVPHIAGVVLMFTALVPALANATAETGDSGGHTPTPTPGSTAETGWNPTHACTSNGNIYDLMRCLGGYFAPSFICERHPSETSHTPLPGCNPPPYDASDYDVDWEQYPHIGVGFEIIRKCSVDHPCPDNVAEPDRLYLKENDPNIQWTRLTLPRLHLVARIGIITETPSPIGGPTRTIEVTLNNGTPIVVTTNGKNGEDELTYALIAAIQQRGFIVQLESTYAGPYIKVTGRGANINGITEVSFRSTDPLITKSDIRIDTTVMDYPPPPPPDL